MLVKPVKPGTLMAPIKLRWAVRARVMARVDMVAVREVKEGTRVPGPLVAVVS